MKLRDILLSICSGLLLILSFPKLGYAYLAWVALVPLLWALRGKTLKCSFYLGYIVGFVHFSGILYWIVHVATTYGNLPYLLGVAVMALLVLYLSVYIAVFALLFNFFRKASLNQILCAPVLWVSLEYIRSLALTGFPWENLGCSQFFILKIIQISDIFGVYGISFLIVLVNGSIFYVLSEPIPWFQKIKRYEVFLTLAAISLTFLYGSFRINHIESLEKEATHLKVTLVQGCIDQAIKWNPSFQEETVKIYQRLTLDAKKDSPNLIIWPETATPFYFLKEQEYSPIILDTVKKTGSFLLLGSPAYHEEDGQTRIFNRAYLISPEARVAGIYDKVHLVPFGEYVPLQRFLPFAKKLVGDVGVGNFYSGESAKGMPIPQGKLGVLICFESIFPELSRDLVRNGVNLLVNITNDAWFGETSAPYQHFSMAVFRAVENRVSLVRCANTGISGFIDLCGRIKNTSPLFERLTMTESVKIIGIKSFYTRYGDVFAILCLFASILWGMKGFLILKRGTRI